MVTGPGGARPVDCHDVRVAVVAARRQPRVMDGLLAGARRALADHHVEQPGIVRVPGIFELPVVARALTQQGYEAVVVLGVVIGQDLELEQISAAAIDALSRTAVDTGAAMGLGLLACATEQQALDRAGGQGSREDRGYDATTDALATALTLRRIRRGWEPDVG
jgi:6,7-dimethyl-8-ribityllumazine synthase